MIHEFVGPMLLVIGLVLLCTAVVKACTKDDREKDTTIIEDDFLDDDDLRLIRQCIVAQYCLENGNSKYKPLLKKLGRILNHVE